MILEKWFCEAGPTFMRIVDVLFILLKPMIVQEYDDDK